MSDIVKKAYAREAETGFNYRTAMEEASRCLLCEDAPCSRDCPASTNPAKFIRSLRFKNIKGAAETIRENNPLGGCCAWVCPYDRLCEKACSRVGIDRPIKIGSLQRFLIEEEERGKMDFIKAKPLCGKKVACIGSGPASLSCARQLAAEGVSVEIYECKASAGGILSHGITPTRLPQRVVDHDIELIKRLGVKFHFDEKISKENIDSLKDKFDAIFIGIGLWSSKKPDIKGKEFSGVEYALDFLERARSNTKSVVLNDDVVVIGGGNVAMDCVSTAKQLGAKNAVIVYRRSIEEAPADIDELKFVQSMGITVITNFIPEEIKGSEGRVKGIRFRGRDGYSELLLNAQHIIFAIGQEQVSEFKDIKEKENIFIGGDATHSSGATVVEAVAQGKASAVKILDYFKSLDSLCKTGGKV